MNKNVVTLVVSVAAIVICAIGWFVLPSLQDARQAVDDETSVQLERARRLLDKYNTSLAHRALLTDRLSEQDVEVDPDDLSDDVADDYQQLHAVMWEAYQPVDWPEGGVPTPAHPRYGNLPGQIRSGLTETARLVRENEKLLDDADRAVDQALAVTKSGESSRSHAEANRLKSVILYHKGLAKRMEAQLHRRDSDRYRRELMSLATDAGTSRSAQTLVADTQVDVQIARLKAKTAELKAVIGKDRETLAALDARIRDLEARFLAAEARAAQALKNIDAFKAQGIDFSDPGGAESFQTRLEEQDRLYRKTARKAHALMHGTYPNARIDQSGDYLTGRYVEDESGGDPAVEYGLVHYRSERAVLVAEIDGRKRGLDDFRSDIARLEGMKNDYESSQTQAAGCIAESVAAASEAYAELNRIDSEAFAIEDEALGLLDRSLKTAKQAAGYADRWLRDAGNRTRGLSMEAKNRSAFGGRLSDGWMGGFIAAQEADAHLAKAWIQHVRYDAYTQNAKLLADVAELVQLTEADVESEQTKATQAHDAGLDDIKESMAVLQRAHGKTERHWTITAQAAGATYLLALFGHEEYVTEAIEAYRTAVQGRENERFAEVFLSRLSRLENR